LDIGILKVGDSGDAVGGGGEFALEEAVIIELIFFDDTGLGHEDFEGEGEGDERILEGAEDGIAGFEDVGFLFEAELDEGVLGGTGGLLLFCGEVLGTGGLLFPDEGEEEVGVIEAADAEVEGIVEDLAEEEIAGMGLHLLEVLMDLGEGHDAGSADAGIIGGLAGIFTGGEVEGEHIEMALHGGDKLVGRFLEIQFPRLSGIRGRGFVGHGHLLESI